EDLGAVPDFVRASLARQGVPGHRVLRWEVENGVFRDPRTYPELSVATSGTHDTSSLATWWSEELDDAGRRALAAVPVFAPLAGAGAFTPAVHAALLDGLYAAGSRLVLLPVQDAYGGRERINTPATVGPANWSYRLPWAIEELAEGAGRSVAARPRDARKGAVRELQVEQRRPRASGPARHEALGTRRAPAGPARNVDDEKACAVVVRVAPHGIEDRERHGTGARPLKADEGQRRGDGVGKPGERGQEVEGWQVGRPGKQRRRWRDGHAPQHEAAAHEIE